MYDIEKYYQALDVADAVRALKSDSQAVVICGGSDVLIKIREGKLAGCSLVSIHGLKELTGVKLSEDGTIVIGPATTFASVAEDETIEKYIPVLGRAADQAGGPQLRNVGTIGGNICNGATSADSAPSLMALDAELELTGPEGVRRLPITEFYAGPGKTIRRREELLTAIRIRRENYEDFFGCYIKYGKRNAMELSTLGCTALVRLDGDKRRVLELRLAYGVAAPTPIRCPLTERAAAGMDIGRELLDTVGREALKEVTPRSSWRASKEFRLQLAQELGKRALKQAILFAGGDVNCLES